MKLRAELAALVRFLPKPRRRRVGDGPWLQRVLLLSVLFGIGLMPLDPLIDRLAHWAGASSPLPNTVTAEFLFEVLLIAPILEELIFRAGLRNPTYALCVGPLLMLLVFAPFTRWSLAIGIVMTLTSIVMWRWVASRAAGRRLFIARYPTVFWGYISLFALAHLGNFEPNSVRAVILPLMVLPQFIIGALIGYIRLRDGVGPGMLMHFLLNLIGVTQLVVAS